MHELGLIVIAGHIGAGKTTAAKYLQREYGVRHMSFVETIWLPILKARGLLPTRENLQLLGVELMEERGPASLVDELLALCTKDGWHTIDDVRAPTVFELIAERAPRSKLLFLETPFETRFPRLTVRDGVADEDAQREAERYQTETGIDALRPYAQWILSNEGSSGDLEASLDAIARELQIGRTA